MSDRAENCTLGTSRPDPRSGRDRHIGRLRVIASRTHREVHLRREPRSARRARNRRPETRHAKRDAMDPPWSPVDARKRKSARRGRGGIVLSPRGGTSVSRIQSVLDKLQLRPSNAGACTGPDGWLRETHGREIVSTDPATGRPLASVATTSEDGYDRVVAAASAAFASWRDLTRAEARRPRSRSRGGPSGPEGVARRPCDHRNGKDPRRRTRRSPGDDRHLRLRRWVVAAVLRPHARVRAAGPSDDGAVASARSRSASSPPSTFRSPSGRGMPRSPPCAEIPSSGNPPRPCRSAPWLCNTSRTADGRPWRRRHLDARRGQRIGGRSPHDG